ncbi:MAG: alpha/beta hydrolase [Muribaculaceae bacterium]|nr:alpha/beta hydrolase [Muribaculaceae bacterium]
MRNRKKIYLLFCLMMLIVQHLSAAGYNIWANTDVRKTVKLTPYLAKEKDAPAIIVCPGGSYFWLDRKTEGEGVARWLQENGISAFVLEYRVAGVPAFITHNRYFKRGNRYPDPLQDLQRSIMLVRDSADHYNIDPEKVGVIGFSAGGHLSALSGIMYGTDLLASAGIRKKTSVRPDFIASIYPVVSFIDKCSHKRSCRGLLGEGKDKTMLMRDSLSLERKVRKDMPPLFLVNCKDDPIVDYRNSELLDSALSAKRVKHIYYQFEKGGHGFGATSSKTTEQAARWKEFFLEWLRENRFLKQSEND